MPFNMRNIIALEICQAHFTCQAENHITKDNSPEGYFIAGELGETGERNWDEDNTVSNLQRV
jgi:hypothetical protein